MGGKKGKKKKGREKKSKGSRGREHSFPIYMHSQKRAESLATRNRTAGTRAAGCGVGGHHLRLSQDSGRAGPGSPASPVGFVFLGHLLRQFLQNSFFQGQILSKWKAVQVPCDFAREH